MLAGGYKSEELPNGNYSVWYSGNGATSKQQARDFALLRASEICLEKNKSFVEVLNMKESTGKMYKSPGITERYPVATLTVRFHSKKPGENSNIYSAQQTKARIATSYDLRLD